MPRKKSDKAILAEIREVIDEVGNGWTEDPRGPDHMLRLRKDDAYYLIKDLLNGTETRPTQKYRKAKAAASASANAAPT